MKQEKDRLFLAMLFLCTLLSSFTIHSDGKRLFLPEWKEYAVIQGDVSESIEDEDRLKRALHDGLDAVVIGSHAELGKQVSANGMIALSAKTIEEYQKHRTLKDARLIVFARLRTDAYVRYAIQDGCFLEYKNDTLYGANRWLDKYLDGALEITSQLVSTNRLRLDIHNLAGIPLKIKFTPQEAIRFGGNGEIELKASSREVLFATLKDMALPTYLLEMDVANFCPTNANTGYIYSVPVKGMLFSEREDVVLRRSVIPLPKTVSHGDVPWFVIHADTKILLHTKKVLPELHFLTNRLKQAAQLSLAIVDKPSEGTNVIEFSEINEAKIGDEGYRLNVSDKKILIEANERTGFFYGIQTLLQLLPPEIYSNSPAIERRWDVPSISIEDTPQFVYRGLHLDVSRHFYPVSFIKKYIDLLAMQKMNYFHWHLTDDQGWRLEIKKYPLLTQKGAWRDSTAINHPSSFTTPIFEKKVYGGYYTQEQVCDIVAYAAERHVTVIPEIDLPGHMLAALAAYPALGCMHKDYQVGTQWGIYSDVLCVGNKDGYRFIEDIMTEVISLFPGRYIHIGGDECPKGRWKACEKCQNLMHRKNIPDEYALQSYVISHVGKFLKRHDKQLIGWDEVLEGGIGKDAVIMSWRGVKGGITAAQSGNSVIMTPNTYMYLNHYQSNMLFEPLAHGRIASLEWVYSFNPIPSVLSEEESKRILGVQGNVWSEYLPTCQMVEYTAYPRASAVAEMGWSPVEKRDWKDYLRRLQIQFERWRYYNLNCGLHYKNP